MEDLRDQTVTGLLRIHGAVLDELRRRAIVRSANGPAGDYAEVLFSRAFGWTLAGGSSSGHDAVDANGARFQIKCRRITARNASRQLSALRNLPSRPFDILAAVLLDEQYRVLRAALIPIDVVIERSTFTAHVNAHRFILRDPVWGHEGVTDVTDQLRQIENTL